MPFPFLPGGAIVAAAVLLSAITGFVTAMMAIDRTATRVFGAAVSGVVSGARRWRDGTPGGRATGRRTSDVLRPITSASLASLPDRPAIEPDAPGDPGAGSTATSVLTDEGVEPVEILDRVRPRMR